MSKPIEEGCLVLVIKVTHEWNYLVGCSGVVTLYDADDDDWQVDTKFGVHAYRASQLIRIDDYDGNETCTWESCDWKPAEVSA